MVPPKHREWSKIRLVDCATNNDVQRSLACSQTLQKPVLYGGTCRLKPLAPQTRATAPDQTAVEVTEYILVYIISLITHCKEIVLTKSSLRQGARPGLNPATKPHQPSRQLWRRSGFRRS